MKKIMIGLVAMSSLVFGTGCGGGDLCEDSADAIDTLIEKTEDCEFTNTFIKALKPTDKQIDECKDDLDGCSDADKDKYEDFFDCINDLDECKAADEQAWGDTFEACSDKIDGVSDTCGT